MKLKEYAEKINKLAEIYPDAKVIYAADEEGNSFQEVIFEPTVGCFSNYEFDQDGEPVDCVCIN